MPPRSFLLLVNDIASRLRRGVSLDAVARGVGSSRFALHREFRRHAGETLKQFTLRLRLERAAAELAATSTAIRAVALGQGFRSHEVFVRAFRRYFGSSPSDYRRLALGQVGALERRRHLALTRSIGPAVRFLHQPRYKYFGPRSPAPMAPSNITRIRIEPQHILRIRRRIAPSELTRTLGECFGQLFAHAAKRGLPIAGWPVCRYVSTGLGLWTIEPAVVLATPATSEGDMVADTLPGGWVALGIHTGPYDRLPDTNAAIERWIEANGYASDGATWEHYVTDPAQHPDSSDWRTEVYWPLKADDASAPSEAVSGGVA